MGITYRDAGVDVDAGDALVERIKPLAKATRRPEVLADVGGFAGMMRLPSGLQDPVLVSGTDGVGTKLKVAFAANEHGTIGRDLVAMCVNDVATCGAEPLFFLDYFATSKLDVSVGEAVVRGIADGCKDAGCALLGGETAELPGMYADGEYDLAGFCVGVVERAKIIDGKLTRAGDVLLGVASSGLHSNGYSLVRRAVLEHAKLALTEVPAGFDRPLAQVLLEPTRIYARALKAAIAAGGVHAVSHITGGGIGGNVPRVLPAGLGAVLDVTKWERPKVFDLVQQCGGVSEDELRKTFNLGLGLVIACDPDAADAIERALKGAGERVFRVGEVVACDAHEDDYDARARIVSGAK